MIAEKHTMNDQFIKSDCLIFTPDDVDLSFSPLRKYLKEKTFVLGAFNPALCRLPSGNLMMMVRVAEALSNPVAGTNVYTIRWDEEKNYHTEGWPLAELDMKDPRNLFFQRKSVRLTQGLGNRLLGVHANDECAHVMKSKRPR